MSKKNEVQIVMPVSGDQIDSSIDMKLTKQDLIDMVIEETRDRLEAQVATAQENCAIYSKQVEAERKKLEVLLVKELRSKYKKEFKLITTNGKEHLQVSREGAAATEHGLLMDGEMSYNYDGRNHRKLVLDDKETEIVTHKVVPTGVTVKNNDRNYDRAKKETSVMNISVYLHLTKSELQKLYAPFLADVKHMHALDVHLDELRAQLKSVDKMGKKAKTQLVKRMLESSENGQAILSNMGAIKTSVSQLLLESSKKACDGTQSK
jgi:hypothetical protein